jgi:hypothetical protein
MPEKLARLTAIGFLRIGSWKLTDRGLTFEIDEQLASARNVLYAFAVDGSLAYIGKTIVPLRDRLQRYKTPAKSAEKGGSTNIKNNRNILQSLRKGRAVEIFVLQSESRQEHGGFVVNLAAGLEDSLVADLSPPWNGRPQSNPTAVQPISSTFAVTVEPKVIVGKSSTRVTAADLRDMLSQLLLEASSAGASHADIQAGGLHRRVGGYPGTSHAMPVCCDVMRAAMRAGDIVLSQPPKGKGASLTIRYKLPHES